MMKTGSRFLLLTVTLLMVFIFSAMLTVPAYADDSIPPPTETPTEATPPVDESTLEPVPVAEESMPVVEETTAENLAQIPEGTELVVVNEEGETVPLASEEAAQLVEVVDPMWCPAGVNPGAVTCSIGYVSLSALVVDLGDGVGFVPSGNGVIWIQGGTDPGAAGTSILINGLTAGFTGIANFNLTLKGGWNGCNPGCVNTVNTANPSVFDQSLSIINWNGAITLSDITITHTALSIQNAALNIQTTRKITLTNVKVNSNSNVIFAAWLDNQDGDPLVFGDVSITNSTFNGNTANGLYVFSEGAITFANVLVNGNGGSGAALDNSTAASAKAVTITTGTNEFNDNTGGDGLNILSKGAISFKDITASNNGGGGLLADNSSAGTAQAVTLTGLNMFLQNNSDGLVVNSKGAISASYLIANNNNGWGALLDNTSATTAQPVKLTGLNEFKFNGGGLWIKSQGAITTENVTAIAGPIGAFQGNADGVKLWNGYNFTSSVTMNGTNVFTKNYNDGLQIDSKGTITLSNITANENGVAGSDGFGVSLNNSFSTTPMAVTLKGTNTFNGNYSGGLVISSKGAVTLSKVTASENTHGYGAAIKNDYGSASAPQNVTLTIANTFNDNYHSGLLIYSYGAIAIANLTSNNNGTLSVVNPDTGATLDNSGGTLPKAVTLTGNNTFTGNLGNGLQIKSLGSITLNNVKAESNTSGTAITGMGASLNNQLPGALGGVTLTNTAGFVPSFSYNEHTGLYITSFGIITIKDVNASGNVGGGLDLDNDNGSGNINLGNIYASFNGTTGLLVHSTGTITLAGVEANGNDMGALIYNDTAALPRTVTITGYGIFNNNPSGGLRVFSKAAITVNNITANNNTGNPTGSAGAILDNTASTVASPQSVTIKGTNEFNNNFLYGFWVATYGAILINNVTADNNGSSGTIINHGTGISPTAITITGYGNFNNNAFGGLKITTNGAITLNNITANSNGGLGVELDNTASTSGAPQNVTINGTNEFSGNTSTGLLVITYGAILTNNLTANDNGLPGSGYGVTLQNFVGVTLFPKTVTLNGVNTFNHNKSGGLKITSMGAIKVNNLDAGFNIGYGANFNNEQSVATGSVNLTGNAYVEDNGLYGLQVNSFGAIKIANLNIFSNGGIGAYLDNSASNGGVTLTGVTQVYENTADGLKIETKGVVLLGNLYVQANGSNGVMINNTFSGSATPQNVTLTSSNYFYNNGNDGLHIITYGVILLNNIDSEGNGGYGAWLDNCGYNTGFDTCTSLGAPKAITLTGLNFFHNNTMDGLWATSLGAITISNLTANWNQGFGAHLNNQWDSAVGGIILTGANTFEHNELGGLEAYSHGAVNMSNLSANSNLLVGAYIDNRNNGIQLAPVTVTGVNTFSNNGGGVGSGDGLFIFSDGQITLSNITAENNVGNGANIFSERGGVKITGINSFNYNGYGLYIDAYKNIDLSNITADLNNQNGSQIISRTGNITITCGSFNNNASDSSGFLNGYGYKIVTDAASGQVTLKGVNGDSNRLGNMIVSSQPVITQRSCIPPPPVAVSQPAEDDDDGVGAGSVQLPNYERH